MQQQSALIVAGVVVTLAFFALIAYVVGALRATKGLASVITAIAALVAAFPAILYALYRP
jgi:hypothetical protein